MRTVDVVLATYRPNMVYFEKLLYSLNNQTYPNIKLLVRDDSDDKISFNEISKLINKIITSFSFTIVRNDKNLGSNITFEKLTRDATGNYIAFCDQDDIWEKEKIEKLVSVMETENAVLSYSDLSIIDEKDSLRANSFKDIHKRLEHVKGDNLFEFFLRRNSVTGCTMLIKSEVAKDAIPFCNKYYVHDHWLTLYASAIGRISYIEEPLVRYRIHGGNQIGASMLNGIENRKDYYEKKLLKERKKYLVLLEDYNFNKNQIISIQKMLKWTEKRILFFEEKGIRNTISTLKNISEDYQLVLLEFLINLAPRKISGALLKKIKN